jgi:hypothetical protein
MSYEMHLCRFQSDLETEGTIQKEEWLNCLEQIGNLYYDNADASVKITGEEVPLLWLNLAYPNSASASADYILADNQRFDTLRLLAQQLNAFLWGDDTELYYFPGAEKLQHPRELKLPMSEFIEMMQAHHHNTDAVIAQLNGEVAYSDSDLLVQDTTAANVLIAEPVVVAAAPAIAREVETIDHSGAQLEAELQEVNQTIEASQTIPATDTVSAPTESPKKGNWFLRLLGLR